MAQGNLWRKASNFWGSLVEVAMLLFAVLIAGSFLWALYEVLFGQA